MTLDHLAQVCAEHLDPYLPGTDWHTTLAPVLRGEKVDVAFKDTSGKALISLSLAGPLETLLPTVQIRVDSKDRQAVMEAFQPILSCAMNLVRALKAARGPVLH